MNVLLIIVVNCFIFFILIWKINGKKNEIFNCVDYLLSVDWLFDFDKNFFIKLEENVYWNKICLMVFFVKLSMLLNLVSFNICYVI